MLRETETQKNVLPPESGASGTGLFGKSALGYCITFIKRLHVGLRQQLLEQKPLILPGFHE